jgi:hypothetical protein
MLHQQHWTQCLPHQHLPSAHPSGLLLPLLPLPQPTPTSLLPLLLPLLRAPEPD